MNSSRAIHPGGGIREQLRGATANIHAALHEHPAFTTIQAGTITGTEYRTLLARLYGFHLPLEQGLRSHAGNGFMPLDLRAREKAGLLRADLCAIGLSPEAIGALPLWNRPPASPTTDELFGYLYVVEGAALGGRVLARQLDHLFGPGNSEGRRFFTGRSEPDAPTWPMFCRLLEARAAHGDAAAIIRTAVGAMESIAHWLRGSGGRD